HVRRVLVQFVRHDAREIIDRVAPVALVRLIRQFRRSVPLRSDHVECEAAAGQDLVERHPVAPELRCPNTERVRIAGRHNPRGTGRGDVKLALGPHDERKGGGYDEADEQAGKRAANDPTGCPRRFPARVHSRARYPSLPTYSACQFISDESWSENVGPSSRVAGSWTGRSG